MWPGRPNLELPLNVFKILSDLIRDHTGIYYDAAKASLLSDKLSPLAIDRGFASFLDYYYLLKYGPDADAEWLRVVDALSVPETYFWREMGQIHALVNELLPKYLERLDKPVRIWCAACATGEEPLTIAMALAELGWFEKVPIEIHASDASSQAIAKARKGVFRERSFRAFPPELREKYFEPVNDGWQVKSEIHSRISWSQANLVNDQEISKLSRVPFLFCRNVFIYFTDATIRKVIKAFSQEMTPPGHLFVGAAESLLKLTADFELRETGSAFAYVRKEVAT